jgi:hypothetical protein
MKAIKRPDGALLPYCKIHEAMDALEAEHLDLDLDAAEADLVTQAVNEPGPVDDQREACYVPVRGDRYNRGPGGTMACHVSRRSLPVLMRRLQELGGQRGEELVGRICFMLGVRKGSLTE